MDERDSERARLQRNRDIPKRYSNMPSRSRPTPRSGRNLPPQQRNIRPQERTTSSRNEYEPPYNEYGEEDEYIYEPGPRRRPRRKRSFLPAFLGGCATAIICIVIAAAALVFYTLRLTPGNTLVHIPGLNGTHAYTQSNQQQVTLTNLTQLQVCNKIGNVKIMVDPQASQATITTQKIVQATNQDEANQDLKRIAVEIQPPGSIQHPLSCARFATASANSQAPGSTLTINTINPASTALSSGPPNRVDIAITLPPGALPQNGPSMALIIEAPIGNIEADGLSGQFSIKGSTGDVTIKNAYLTPGSDIETGQGNITFNGRLITPDAPAAQSSAYFKLSSEKGNIDVTLPDTTNVNLDSNTNAGTIKSEFNNQVHTEGESANSQGPLNASSTAPVSTLVIDVSLGNVILHKQQTTS